MSAHEPSFPDDFATAIIGIGSIPEFTFPPRELRVPTEQRLKQLIAVAYQASLAKEEGRSPRFSLLYQGPPYGQLGVLQNRYPPSGSRYTHLNPPREFSARELLRLAPALDERCAQIFVSERQISSPPSLQITGIVDVGTWSWEQARSERIGGIHVGGLRIVSQKPGHIGVSVDGWPVAKLLDGEIFYPSDGEFVLHHWTEDFFERIERAETSLQDAAYNALYSPRQRPHPNVYGPNEFAIALKRMIVGVLALEHGGSIILLPDKDARDSLIGLNPKLRIKYLLEDERLPPLLFQRTVERCIEDSRDLPPPTKSARDLSIPGFKAVLPDNELADAITAAINFTSRLTSVDGALVLSEQLSVLGFGAEILGNLPDPDVVVKWPRRSTASTTQNPSPQEIDTSLFGTRHRSAFRFVASTPSALMIVVSQDGGAKIVRKLDRGDGKNTVGFVDYAPMQLFER